MDPRVSLLRELIMRRKMMPLDKGLTRDMINTAIPILMARGMLARTNPDVVKGNASQSAMRPEPVSEEGKRARAAAERAAEEKKQDDRKPIGKVDTKKYGEE